MPKRPTPSPEDLARENEQLRRDNERARADRDRLRDEVDRLDRERVRLERELERLTQALDTARRAGCRQAVPFSKGPPTPAPRRVGRRAGPAYGRHGHRRRPAHIDTHVDVPLPATCPGCGGAVQYRREAVQLQEDLPVVRPLVRAFHVHIGRCRACGRRVQGRHATQTSDALGAAAAHLGPQVVALIVLLNKQWGLSHAKVATLLREWFGLTVTPGAISQALHRAARQTVPTYAHLRATVRGSPVVTPDETSWKVAGRLQWLWAFATPTTVVYAIQPGRGFPQAAAVLGRDYDGVLVRDGWAPYRQFTAAAHQSCVAHLLRRCRTLGEDHPRARLPRRVQAVLQEALVVRDRVHDGRLSSRGLAAARGRFMRRLAQALAHPGPTPAIQRFAAHLCTESPAIFGFLFDPAVDATNWRAEQAIRPAVVTRKVSGGNRSARGAATQQILASVVQTARLRGLDTRDVLVDLLRAPAPHVSPALDATS